MGFGFQSYPCTAFLQTTMPKEKKQVTLAFTLLQHINVSKSQRKRWQDTEKPPRGRGCKAVFYFNSTHSSGFPIFHGFCHSPKTLGSYHDRNKNHLSPRQCLSTAKVIVLQLFCKRFISPRQILRPTLAETLCYGIILSVKTQSCLDRRVRSGSCGKNAEISNVSTEGRAKVWF